LQAGGRRFDPGWLHSENTWKSAIFLLAQNTCPDRGKSREKASGSVEIVRGRLTADKVASTRR
jgi:hypothetical protein